MSRRYHNPQSDLSHFLPFQTILISFNSYNTVFFLKKLNPSNEMAVNLAPKHSIQNVSLRHEPQL